MDHKRFFKRRIFEGSKKHICLNLQKISFSYLTPEVVAVIIYKTVFIQ